jgi:glucokinase
MSMQVPGWNDFRLKDWFEDRFTIRTRVVNDTVAGGFAELVLGSGRECKNFFYTNIGSGIGGAMFINRKYYDGIGFGASYLGNTYVADWTASLPGVVCKLESLCSGLGIEARIRMPGYVPKSSMLTELCGGITENLTCAMLGKAATAGDIFALDEVDRIAYAYGAGLCNLLALMSPDCITIGGGVAKLGDILLNPIRKYVEEMAFISNKGHFQILESRLFDNAVIVGAILCAAETQQRLPRVPGRSMSTGVVSQRIANSK